MSVWCHDFSHDEVCCILRFLSNTRQLTATNSQQKNMSNEDQGIAKVIWDDPISHVRREFVLAEGATAGIGRGEENDIQIAEKHVSRRHAVIRFRDGIFMIEDLGSANGTFVNDRRLTEPFPLAHGDVIRLYVPVLNFSAIVSENEKENARRTGTFIVGI